MGIGRAHRVEARQRRHQHEQGRARQVEIGHQGVDGAEPVARRDEDRSLAGKGRQPLLALRRAFQDAQRGGADGDDLVAARPHGAQRGDRLCAHLAPLGMHAVLVGVVRLDGKERARPHMQRHPVPLDAARIQRRQQLVGEVQACGRRGDGPVLFREDRLVVLPILLVLAALGRDIRRQRDMADGGDRLVQHRTGEVEDEQNLARVALFRNRCVQRAQQAGRAPAPGLRAELNPVADDQLLGRAHEGPPAVVARAQVQRRADPRHRLAARAGAFQLRRDHPRVVEDQRIARLQQHGQVAHAPVL